MRPPVRAEGLALLLAGLSAAPAGAHQVPASLARFLAAPDAEARAAARTEVLESGVDLGTALAVLRTGREYGSDAPTGRHVFVRMDENGVRFPWFVQVPSSYTPERRWPVRVYLHGGVGRATWEAEDGSWWRQPDRVASEAYIGVFPAAWDEAPWWSQAQLENLREILRVVRRTWNVDENRVALSGVSDGGTGTWWVAFRDPTPFASFLPFIGHPIVLLNPAVGAEGEPYPANLAGKPFLVINGEEDRLYPARSVDPFIREFASFGALIEYRPKRGYGHETGWWPEEAARMDAFIADWPREPHPRCLSWETESPEAAGRTAWLRIDALGATPLDAALEGSALMGVGVPSGRVDAVRDGNEVRLRSSGVRALTLLLSPDAFDLLQPVRVTWNGAIAHDAPVPPSLETLLRWAERDDDRTMLYAAELHLEAPRTGGGGPAWTSDAACR